MEMLIELKKISELKNMISVADAETAATASLILRSISKKKPDDFLKLIKDRLKSHIPTYEKNKNKSIVELQESISDIKNMVAIDVIIILHLILKITAGSNIQWPQQRKIITTKSKIYQPDIKTLIRLTDAAPSVRPPYLVSEYIDGNREMPPDSPFPGVVDLSKTAMAIEIMNRFSPYDPTRYIDLMSAAQVFKTFTIENLISYGIGANPSPMLYISGTKEMLKKWSKRLESMLDSMGLRHLFHTASENPKARGSGDRNEQKLFTGGFLEMGSAQSGSSIRADSIKYLFIDEANSAPPLLTTGEGIYSDVAEARTKQWEDRKKIWCSSTPTVFGIGDIIHGRFLLGDQCQCLLPCPHCGYMQVLERGTENGNHGLRPETKAGVLQYVWYKCANPACQDPIYEHHKIKMFPKYKWEPTATPEKYRHSYQIGSLYSPFGGYSWETYWTEYKTALAKTDGMRSFTNLNDGLPYRETVASVDREHIHLLQGEYVQDTVPDHILYLTLAIDVQRGSKKKNAEGARLEIEILGHASKYRTASVTYRKFEGAIDNAFDGAYENFFEWAKETGITYKKRDGHEMTPVIMLIDSGDGMYNDIVYEFSQRFHNMYPIRGNPHEDLAAVTKIKPGDGDQMSNLNFLRFKESRVANGTVPIFHISTNYYKRHLYLNLKRSIRAMEDKELDPNIDIVNMAGFSAFPMKSDGTTYNEAYFKSLTNEGMRKSDQSFHKIIESAPNEGADLRVYNLCASDIYLSKRVERYQEECRLKLKWTPSQCKKIDTKYIIERMERLEAVRIMKKT